jgi:hypothetical protein
MVLLEPQIVYGLNNTRTGFEIILVAFIDEFVEMNTLDLRAMTLEMTTPPIRTSSKDKETVDGFSLFAISNTVCGTLRSNKLLPDRGFVNTTESARTINMIS